MLVVTFIVFHRLLSFTTSIGSRNIFIALCMQMCIVIISQILTGDSAMQQLTFTCMIYWLWYKTFRLIGSTIFNEELKRKMRTMATSGIGTYIN